VTEFLRRLDAECAPPGTTGPGASRGCLQSACWLAAIWIFLVALSSVPFLTLPASFVCEAQRRSPVLVLFSSVCAWKVTALVCQDEVGLICAFVCLSQPSDSSSANDFVGSVP
jgi:hypothetical protein